MGVNGIYGLASGLDIESLVTQAMTAKQNQYDSMYKKKTKAEWSKDAYNDWYKKLSDFQNNTLYKYALSGSTAAKTASTSDSSIVTATAGGAAASMSHKVSVNALASNASLRTIGSIGAHPTKMTPILDANKKETGVSTVDGLDTNTTSIKLSDLLGFASVKYNAEKVTGDGSDNVVITTKGDDGKTQTYTIGSDHLNDTAISFTIKDGTQTDGKYNSYQVKLSYRDLVDSTYNDLANKINTAGSNISANYNASSDSFSIYNRNSGEANGISITLDDVPGVLSNDAAGKIGSGSIDADNEGMTVAGRTAKLLSGLKLGTYNATTSTSSTTPQTSWHVVPRPTDDDTDPKELGTISVAAGGKPEAPTAADANNKFSSWNPITKGTNSTINVDGKDYTTGSNTVTVDGVIYTLQSVSKDNGSNGKVTSTVTVNTDIDTIVKNVKQFVDDYNKMLADLKTTVSEKPDKDYQPLTDKEKKGMSDDQVKKWEDKAKEGLLYHDSTLTELTSDMRSAVGNNVAGVGGQYTSLYSIGITASDDFKNNQSGILSVDEDKLRKALETDSDAAYKLFANPAADKSDPDSNGIIKKLNTSLTKAIGTGDIATASGIRGLAGVNDSSNVSDQSYYANSILGWQEKMSAFKTAMNKYQDSLYSQFDAMETAISNLNSQYSFISSYNS